MNALLFRFLLFAAVLCGGTRIASAQNTAEASDRAFAMGMKYSAQGFYLAPSHEGRAGFATTMEFLIPVQRGLDYVFILAGDRYCLDVDVWVEDGSEGGSGNTIVRDTRKVENGLCGVRWRSQFNGSVVVVVHFAKVTSRCGWAALVGRRGTIQNPYAKPITTTPGTSSNPSPTTSKQTDTKTTGSGAKSVQTGTGAVGLAGSDYIHNAQLSPTKTNVEAPPDPKELDSEPNKEQTAPPLPRRQRE